MNGTQILVAGIVGAIVAALIGLRDAPAAPAGEWRTVCAGTRTETDGAVVDVETRERVR